ncbi:unnamed protein product [Larinioides sclopetarius]|uniref:MADF domain-containing protein n=1 Tax=Larinioides sclopetarius TaxID=280406 RepID=A0AAV2AN49_9ARAC
MDRKAYVSIWKDESKEDINTTKFLELLLKYDYIWCQNYEEMKMNLKETDKRIFLKECNESIENVDEMRASLIIDIIRHTFLKEFSSLHKDPKNVDHPLLPWFSQAYRLFKRSFISEAPSITSPSNSTVAIVSITPPSGVPPLKITNDSSSATASFLSSTPTVEPFSWVTAIPYMKLPSIDQEKKSSNPSSLSLKNGYKNESSLMNVKLQYEFPILYPVCILPCASLGCYGEGTDISCSRKESEPFSNRIISDLPSFPQISDFPYLSHHDDIPNPPNSCRPDSRGSETTNLVKNFSQPFSSRNPIEPIATGFTANNSLARKWKNFTNNFSSRESFQSCTARTSKCPDFSTISSTSTGTGTKFSSLPRVKSKVKNSPTTRAKSSTLLPPRY